jgi:hypothetical protein
MMMMVVLVHLKSSVLVENFEICSIFDNKTQHSQLFEGCGATLYPVEPSSMLIDSFISSKQYENGRRLTKIKNCQNLQKQKQKTQYELLLDFDFFDFKTIIIPIISANVNSATPTMIRIVDNGRDSSVFSY